MIFIPHHLNVLFLIPFSLCHLLFCNFCEVYLLARSSGNTAWYFSSNIDIKNVLWFIIKSGLISDINFSNAKSWSEYSVSSLTVSLGMVLLPDLIGLIVFSVKRKVIKNTISSTKLHHKTEWKKNLMQPDVIQIMK
jgi:hypothetical protein